MIKWKLPKSTTKYKNKKVIVDDVKFDSKMEANFHNYLKMKFRDCEIVLQPKFVLQPTFKNNKNETVRSISYKADFQIGDIVIDVKGFETKDFIIKKKLFMYKYPELKLLVGTYRELMALI